MAGSPDISARLQLREKLDPTSSRAFYEVEDAPGIRSDAANTLLSELQLYLSGDLEGLSFLIAGHRGAGKTTLVWQVGRKLLQIGRNRGRAERPLMVPLNGPRLLPAGPGPREMNGADKPQGENDEAPPSEVQIEQIDNDVDRALIEFAVGLCIQLAKTMARGFRDRIREREHLFSSRELQRRYELAAGLVRSRYNFRQDLTIQLAIEMLLEHPDVDAQLRVEPEFRRFVHDALYYPTRCWADRGDDSIDLGDDGYLAFKQYLRESEVDVSTTTRLRKTTNAVIRCGSRVQRSRPACRTSS